MHKHLTLHLDNRNDALTRLLQAVKQHGFTVQNTKTSALDEPGRIEVLLELDGKRSLMNLISQLADLAEVRSLQTKSRPISVEAT
ncbi:ACT domain-containing protein [Chitinimonas sp. PSY-7]|uniref:ACT domain-containing protein n=1 Tax=Chitinimonas sp. PSY-7 TaxID=3459088 RepID=UPI0040400C2F